MQARKKKKTPIERLVQSFQIFTENKVAGAIVLLVATVVALFWANSPWSEGYFRILDLPIAISVSDFSLSKPLLIWINDGLMAFFFFVVGLEIKREILAGELASLRKAALPVAAAAGGMVVPALTYSVFNLGGSGEHGWGVPMATDIAFSLGVLLLLGPRIPISLKVFLTAVAIVDDLGAIVVIAIFYSEGISFFSLMSGGILLLVSLIANWAGLRSSVIYFILGLAVWLFFVKSGVHATLAAVLMAMTIPARTRIDGRTFLERVEELLEAFRGGGVSQQPTLLTRLQQSALQQVNHLVDQAGAPLHQLEHALLPAVTFIVLPIFALANAGVSLGSNVLSAFASPVCLGVIAGLVVGKQVGILAFSWLAVKLRLADLPKGASWRQLHAVGVLGGIGFTMSLFIGSLAFDDPILHQQAKIGILAASAISAILGGWLLYKCAPRKRRS